METKGILKGVSKDWITGKIQLTFEIETDITKQLESILDKALRITIKQWRKKRSLDANSYYWVLIGKFADALHISKPRAHNLILRKYGVDVICDGKLVYIVIPDTIQAEENALEADTFHIRPTSQTMVDKNGEVLRTYIMRKGSSQYDTAEMTHLIEGLVTECKDLGIETLPPDELSRLMSEFEQNRRQKDG